MMEYLMVLSHHIIEMQLNNTAIMCRMPVHFQRQHCLISGFYCVGLSRLSMRPRAALRGVEACLSFVYSYNSANLFTWNVRQSPVTTSQISNCLYDIICLI